MMMMTISIGPMAQPAIPALATAVAASQIPTTIRAAAARTRRFMVHLLFAGRTGPAGGQSHRPGASSSERRHVHADHKENDLDREVREDDHEAEGQDLSGLTPHHVALRTPQALRIGEKRVPARHARQTGAPKQAKRSTARIPPPTTARVRVSA